MAPPNTNSHGHDTPYLNALLNAIPDGAIPPELNSASTSKSVQALPKFIDSALRLASGGSSRPNDDALLRDSWPQIQASLQDTLHALGSPPAHAKRKHSPSPSAQTAPTNNKKSKLEEEDHGIEDPPHLTLHAVSATAPVRHKVDITLHARSLRLAHATSGASVARSAHEALTRAFLLPTRARSSGAPQWTALLLAGDTPTPTPTTSRKNNGAGPGAKGKEKGIARFELACSVPEAGAVPRLTIHSAPSSSSPTNSHTPTPSTPHQALLSLLSSISLSAPPSVHTTPKLVQIERGTPLAGVTAFRGARETSLWFLDGASSVNGTAGILSDTRPAEFWAVTDLAQGDTGVRVFSATGRTCTVILTRRPAPRATSTEGSEEDEEGEETEFQMIDGKEREGIVEWVRKHKSAFGITVVRGTQVGGAGSGAGAEGEVVGKGGDSDSDSNFEGSGESDGGSPSSSGSSSDPGEHEGGEESDNEGEAGERSEGSAEPEGDDDDDDDEEIVELDPKRHPLLRAAAAGAIPKMSRAVVDAAVGLVVDDLVGQGSGASRPSSSPPYTRQEARGRGK
jgi:hypothetical protein